MTAPEAWAAVAAAVRSRMQELGIHKQVDLARRSGLSDATVRVFMTGKLRGQPPRDDSRAAVATALDWSADSIDKILDGGEPDLRSPGPPDRFAAIEARVTALEALILTEEQFATAAYDGRTPTRSDVPTETFNRPCPPAEDGDHLEG